MERHSVNRTGRSAGPCGQLPAERRVVETWSDRAVSIAAWGAVVVSLLSVTAMPWLTA